MSGVLALLVTVPVVAATLPPVLGRRVEWVGWPVAALALAVQVALAGRVALDVATAGPARTVVGGLPPGLGIALVADRLSVVFVVLVAAAGLWGLAYVRRGGPHSPNGHALYLLLVAGLTGICLTRDAFNLYVFLEVAGLASYGLVALGDGDDAAPAALQYLLVGTAGATLYLLGVGFLYVATGTLDAGVLATRLATLGYDDRLVLAAFGLVVVGLGVKVALFPLHAWKPPAYRAAPPEITAVLAALVSTVAAYALLRVLLSVFTVDFLDANPLVAGGLRAAAVVSVVAGALLAFRQPDVRRLLAYSSVSQLGVVVAGFSLGTRLGILGGVVHLLGHAVLKSGAFAAAGVLEAGYGARTVEEYAGGADARPVASASLAVVAFGLVGVPPAVGFFGKWYVTLAAVRTGAWVVAASVLVSTALSLSYFARVVEALYLDAGGGRPDRAPVSTGMVATGAVAAVLAVALGVGSAALVEFLGPAVEVTGP